MLMAEGHQHLSGQLSAISGQLFVLAVVGGSV
jgi:hypothetical protein